MEIFSLYLITPLLGLLRNYIKYKRFSFFCLIRTPIIYHILRNGILESKYRQLFILILERWIMFIYKIIVSIYNNDYITKREKYIKKYNLTYPPHVLDKITPP